MVPAGSTVDYLPGVDLNGTFVTDKEQLTDRARHADIIIAGVVVGASLGRARKSRGVERGEGLSRPSVAGEDGSWMKIK